MSDPPSSAAANPKSRIRLALIFSVVLSTCALALSAVALLSTLGFSGNSGVSSDFEQQARAFLLANPEIIVESVNQLQASEKDAEANEMTAILSERSGEIFGDPVSPSAGNPMGDVTVVEFFDYNCPYCRKASSMLDELERTDAQLRFVFKEFPILGLGSTFAARAALAAQRQGKYLVFHRAMMKHTGSITESSALEIAAAVGLDTDRLKKDIDDPTINQAIDRNLALAQALRLSGTPSFIVGDEISRGLIDIDTIKSQIAAARKK